MIHNFPDVSGWRKRMLLQLVSALAAEARFIAWDPGQEVWRTGWGDMVTQEHFITTAQRSAFLPLRGTMRMTKTQLIELFHSMAPIYLSNGNIRPAKVRWSAEHNKFEESPNAKTL